MQGRCLRPRSAKQPTRASAAEPSAGEPSRHRLATAASQIPAASAGPTGGFSDALHNCGLAIVLSPTSVILEDSVAGKWLAREAFIPNTAAHGQTTRSISDSKSDWARVRFLQLPNTRIPPTPQHFRGLSCHAPDASKFYVRPVANTMRWDGEERFAEAL
jgi:hypothetical protein